MLLKFSVDFLTYQPTKETPTFGDDGSKTAIDTNGFSIVFYHGQSMFHLADYLPNTAFEPFTHLKYYANSQVIFKLIKIYNRGPVGLSIANYKANSGLTTQVTLHDHFYVVDQTLLMSTRCKKCVSMLGLFTWSGEIK